MADFSFFNRNNRPNRGERLDPVVIDIDLDPLVKGSENPMDEGVTLLESVLEEQSRLHRGQELHGRFTLFRQSYELAVSKDRKTMEVKSASDEGYKFIGGITQRLKNKYEGKAHLTNLDSAEHSPELRSGVSRLAVAQRHNSLFAARRVAAEGHEQGVEVSPESTRPRAPGR